MIDSSGYDENFLENELWELFMDKVLLSNILNRHIFQFIIFPVVSFVYNISPN